jgi:cold shock CspA family protein
MECSPCREGATAAAEPGTDDSRCPTERQGNGCSSSVSVCEYSLREARGRRGGVIASAGVISIGCLEDDTVGRLGYWTFPEHGRALHARVVDGQIKFYDESIAWGVIVGDDGTLYVVRGTQLANPPLQVGERVAFEPQSAPGGPRAAAVRRLRSPDTPKKG